jgi:hypothetical protein
LAQQALELQQQAAVSGQEPLLMKLEPVPELELLELVL